MRNEHRSTHCLAATLLGFQLLGQTASAHRIDEYLQATIFSLSVNRIQASMRLIPGVRVAPAVIADIDKNNDGIFSEAEQQAYAQRVLGDLSLSLDGRAVRPEMLAWSFPQPAQMRLGVGEIHIDYWADLPQDRADRHFVVANHHRDRNSVYLMNVLVPENRGIRILAQKRNERQSLYEVDYQQAASNAGIVAKPSAQISAGFDDSEFPSLFHLGMHHIATGTDHLLFLLTLLLPAPLLVAGSRWGPPADMRQSLRRIFGIVTAFTIGHSISLGFGALGVVHVPSRPIEVLIAMSIFVSALHAWRPIAAGREVWIAGCFGLVHGLAFADTLARLGFGRWQQVGGILAFNLGIEAMQLAVVAAILPSLILLSRTRAYSFFRIGGAIFAGAASVGWVVERLFDVATPVDAIVNGFARHAIFIAICLFVLSLACRSMVEGSLSSLKPLTQSRVKV